MADVAISCNAIWIAGNLLNTESLRSTMLIGISYV